MTGIAGEEHAAVAIMIGDQAVRGPDVAGEDFDVDVAAYRFADAAIGSFRRRAR